MTATLPFLRVRAHGKPFVYPGPRDRVFIGGKTGQGKSTLAFFLVSESADFDKKPWVIFDYKGEDIVKEMIRRKDAIVTSLRGGVPDKPGIFVFQPELYEQDLVNAMLWEIYRRGRCGVIFDEVTKIPELRGEGNSGGALQSILNQGRSKEIPVYALAQRPVDVNRHVYTEAEYMCSFRLRSKDDRIRVCQYVNEDDPMWQQFKDDAAFLPNHWSLWYDDRRTLTFKLKPCPDASYILDTISHRVYDLRRRATI